MVPNNGDSSGGLSVTLNGLSVLVTPVVVHSLPMRALLLLVLIVVAILTCRNRICGCDTKHCAPGHAPNGDNQTLSPCLYLHRVNSAHLIGQLCWFLCFGMQTFVPWGVLSITDTVMVIVSPPGTVSVCEACVDDVLASCILCLCDRSSRRLRFGQCLCRVTH